MLLMYLLFGTHLQHRHYWNGFVFTSHCRSVKITNLCSIRWCEAVHLHNISSAYCNRIHQILRTSSADTSCYDESHLKTLRSTQLSLLSDLVPENIHIRVCTNCHTLKHTHTQAR